MWSTRIERVTIAGGEPGEARRLSLLYTGGSCDKSSSGGVYETPQVVVVAVDVVTGFGFCTAVGIPSSVEVTLAAPLGQRVLIAITGDPLPRP